MRDPSPYVALLVAIVPAALAQMSGIVRSESGPVSGATVRVERTALAVTTGRDGAFALPAAVSQSPLSLTAYAPGYYIAGPFRAQPGSAHIDILLKKHPERDHAGYEWVAAASSAGREFNCQNCHADSGAKDSPLPFDEWLKDAHGTSVQSRRFLSMYNGTDLSGAHRSPPTPRGVHSEYGSFPLPPDLTKPYFGPGFKLDFPRSAGACAACHAPAAAVAAPYGTDFNSVAGVGREGVTCDFCHKIWSVRLAPSTGLPYPGMPGVLSIAFRRPPPGSQLFIGPYDDVAGEDTYSPLQRRSQICAPCHYGQFWGVQVYNSFGEWLASSYADPVSGETCQDCHMPRRGSALVARRDKGAGDRDPKTVYSHLMPGASDIALLRDTAVLRVNAQRAGSAIQVRVQVTNARAGHHIPTDHPARNIILVVSATDATGHELRQLSGPVIPDWGGQGNEPADYAGRPGKIFAKVLEELWTGAAPTAAYWNPTRLREDTRLAAKATDTTDYQFAVSGNGGPVVVRATLVFRRAFRTLNRQKGWDTPDVLMNEWHAQLLCGAKRRPTPASPGSPVARSKVPVRPRAAWSGWTRW